MAVKIVIFFFFFFFLFAKKKFCRYKNNFKVWGKIKIGFNYIIVKCLAMKLFIILTRLNLLFETVEYVLNYLANHYKKSKSYIFAGINIL